MNYFSLFIIFFILYLLLYSVPRQSESYKDELDLIAEEQYYSKERIKL